MEPQGFKLLNNERLTRFMQKRTVSLLGRPGQMKMTKIKIGHQEQADKPIYLLSTGAIQCGRFRYEGRHKKKFKAIYDRIASLAHRAPKDGVLDVSQSKYWDAVRIYHEYVVVKWCKSVSATRIERFANETEIVVMLESVKSEFQRAVGLRWKREFRKLDPTDVDTPRQAWQIL
jgi:hypothetical protein